MKDAGNLYEISDKGTLHCKDVKALMKTPQVERQIQAVKRLSMSGHQSARAKSVDWLTPPEWIEKLGPFDLDPCCPKDMPWQTATIMMHQGGLEAEWNGRIWLNPPFGREPGKWLEKLAIHGDGIALVAARTETRWFFDYIWTKCDGICFVRGRPHFYRVDGTKAAFNSGAPIVLVAYGERNVQRLQRERLGKTFRVHWYD